MCKPSPVARAFILGLCAGIASCSPALNWREVRHASAPVRVLMPCKPDVAERNIALREQATVLHMQACSAQGKDFSFAAMSLLRTPSRPGSRRVWSVGVLVQTPYKPRR
jgi:hypothetical protein